MKKMLFALVFCVGFSLAIRAEVTQQEFVDAREYLFQSYGELKARSIEQPGVVVFDLIDNTQAIAVLKALIVCYQYWLETQNPAVAPAVVLNANIAGLQYVLEKLESDPSIFTKIQHEIKGNVSLKNFKDDSVRAEFRAERDKKRHELEARKRDFVLCYFCPNTYVVPCHEAPTISEYCEAEVYLEDIMSELSMRAGRDITTTVNFVNMTTSTTSTYHFDSSTLSSVVDYYTGLNCIRAFLCYLYFMKDQLEKHAISVGLEAGIVMFEHVLKAAEANVEAHVPKNTFGIVPNSGDLVKSTVESLHDFLVKLEQVGLIPKTCGI